LQALVRGHSVRRQAILTLRCMQALVRVQARVRARRVRMSEEGQAIQRQLWQRRQQELLASKGDLNVCIYMFVCCRSESCLKSDESMRMGIPYPGHC
jgi:hypothetical protein